MCVYNIKYMYNTYTYYVCLHMCVYIHIKITHCIGGRQEPGEEVRNYSHPSKI